MPKIQFQGREVDGVDVTIDESSEKFSEFTLGDGSVIRLKPVLLGVTRLEGVYDPEGNPMYMVKAAPVMTIVSAPDKLKRKLQ